MALLISAVLLLGALALVINAVIQQRLAAAREEMSHFDEFDYVIVNEVFEAAVDDMCAIFTASRLRREPQVARHGVLISNLLAD